MNIPKKNLIICDDHDTIIFISYCHKDAKVVHEVADRLQKRCKIWLHVKKTRVGDRLFSLIEKGIRGSLLFVCFISKDYCESEACTDELSFAKSLKKTVLPIMLENEAINGVGLLIAQYLKLYAYKQSKTFNPWSEERFTKLSKDIDEITARDCNTCYQSMQE